MTWASSDSLIRAERIVITRSRPRTTAAHWKADADATEQMRRDFGESGRRMRSKQADGHQLLEVGLRVERGIVNAARDRERIALANAAKVHASGERVKGPDTAPTFARVGRMNAGSNDPGERGCFDSSATHFSATNNLRRRSRFKKITERSLNVNTKIETCTFAT
jgi:hypothetical protein